MSPHPAHPAERLSRPDLAAQIASLAATHTPLPPPERAAVLTPEFASEFSKQVAAHTLSALPAEPPRSWADIVFEKDGVPMADSRKVAEVFEKRHDNVIRAVDELVGAIPQNRGMDFYAETLEPHPTVKGRTIRSFLMTRDGFALLAMGFTGKRALEFKLGFIQAFNDMETALKDRIAAEHRDRLARTTQLLVDAEKQRDAVAGQVKGAQAFPVTRCRPWRPDLVRRVGE